MFSKHICLTFFLILLIVFPPQSSTAERIALVIGNGAYHGTPLENPVNDANDIAAALENLSFKVFEKTNATLREMEAALNNFSGKIRPGDVALFFYAGHGIQYQGDNYLLPVDARINSASDIRYRSLNVGLVMGRLEEAKTINIIILDACRNNPLGRVLSRSVGRGLTIIPFKPAGSYIAYATAPNETADDGEGRNGLFTSAILKHLNDPDVELNTFFMNVSATVQKISDGRQVPWRESSLTSKFYFSEVSKPAAKTNKPPVDPQTKDQGLQSSLAKISVPDPKKNIKNSLGMEFVYIPSGEFLMGSPENEKGRAKDEIQHQVTLTQGYYIQTTEVTQKQWAEVMGTNPSDFDECGDDCPVENVSWEDIEQYLEKVNRLDVEHHYRLPTEAEWEYAARAGSRLRFCSSDSTVILKDYGWFEENSEETVQSVAQKKPNQWGIYDMHGNVWEWCRDYYGPYSQSKTVNPQGPSSGLSRVRRGGGWNSSFEVCRSAYRLANLPDLRKNDIGFRLVKDH